MIRHGGDQRATSVIIALASIVFGVVALAWPVLTLTLLQAWRRCMVRVLRAALVMAALYRNAPERPKQRGRVARWSRTIGASLALVLAIAVALGSGWALGGVPLPNPGKFYTPPASVPDEPGKLIRSERIKAGIPKGADGWRILYTTTNLDGSPAVSSGTIVAPKRRGDDPLPLLSVAHGTTGVAAKCAPSLSATPLADGAGAALEQLVTEHGWAAVTSDYIGLGTAGAHPYLIGDSEARNVLDATRAAQEFADISVEAETVVWGHSQGGQGSLWTGQVAADYAPELTIQGIAAFAPAADLFGLAEVNKTDAAGKTVSAYIASTWAELYPELDLASQLTPGSARGVEKIQDLCFNGKDALSAILHGTQVPNQIFPDRVLDGEFGNLLRAQTPTGPFPAPVLVAQGGADPLVKPDHSGPGCATDARPASRSTTASSRGSTTSRSSRRTPRSRPSSSRGPSTAPRVPRPPRTARRCQRTKRAPETNSGGAPYGVRRHCVRERFSLRRAGSSCHRSTSRRLSRRRGG